MISLTFLVTVATLALVYVMASQLLNLESGWGGMWDLGIAGLVAVGAYSYALLTGPPDGLLPALGLPVGIGMLGAGVITGLVAALLGWPALRLRGEYFLITTFAFAEILRQLIVIRKDVTGGTFGITTMKKPFEMQFTYAAYPYVMLAFILAMTVVLWLIWQFRHAKNSELLGKHDGLGAGWAINQSLIAIGSGVTKAFFGATNLMSKPASFSSNAM